MSFSDIQPYNKLPFIGVVLPDIVISLEQKLAVGAVSDCSNVNFLKQLCRVGFKQKLAHLDKDKQKAYGERVMFELDTIHELGFVNYILMVWDICRFSDEKAIPRGPGRGSVGASLIAYLIGITELDPIENGLFFSRFLSKSRAKKTIVDGITYMDGGLVPDIDCDFSYYRRSEIIEYLNQRYPGQTSKVLTTATFTSKILIKDVMKIYEGASEGQAKDVGDLLEKIHGNPEEIEDALGFNQLKNDKGEQKVKANDRFKEWSADHEDSSNIAVSLSGLNRGEAQHASAVLICDKKIKDLIPIQLTADKELISGFDMYSAQEIVIKMDILGVKTLDVIDEACKILGIKRQDIDINHQSIYDYLANFEHRFGIFQLETPAQGSAATKVKPKNFDQLSAVLAIARPGAIAYLNQFVKYVNEGIYTPLDPLIDDILKPTGGICAYQEQLLAMVNRLGMDLDECEGLRRAIGKKLPEKVKLYKDKIYEVAEKNGHRRELADLIWKIAEDSAGYQFNKSHSACYGMITAYTLYLKANHPMEFYWALLKMSKYDAKGHEVIEQIEKEMRVRGLKLLPPNLVKSDLDFKMEDATSIRFALGMLKGVSEKSMEKLTRFRDEELKKSNNLFQVFQAIKNSGLNIGIGAALAQAGCLDGYGINRTRLVLNICTWNLLSDKEKGICLTIGSKPEISWDVLNAVYYLSINMDEKGNPLIKPSRFETIKKKYQPYKDIWIMNKRNERLANFFYEKTVLGYSYSENLRAIFGEKVSIAEVLGCGPEEEVRLIGFVKSVEAGKTKNGNDCVTIWVTDETGDVMVKFFNKTISYTEKINGRLPEVDDLVTVEGRKKEGSVVFGFAVGIQTAKIYMKLAELKDLTEGKRKSTEEPQPELVVA